MSNESTGFTILSEQDKISSALAKLPADKRNYGKFFLQKLFYKKGAKAFEQFIKKIHGLLSAGVELNTACFEKDEFALLDSIKVETRMPRRQALWALGGAIWCAGRGADNLLALVDGHPQKSSHQSASDYITNASLIGLGSWGIYASLTDGFYEERIASVAEAINEYVQNRKLTEITGR